MPALSRSVGAPLLSIQVLRAVAATTVVVHHAGYDADTLAARFGRAPLGLGQVFDWSFGIHLFFVISGFIMVRSGRGFGVSGAPLRFLAKRLARIVPLYWLMTSLVLFGALLAPGLLNVPVEGWSLFFGSYLFVPVTRINGEIRPILGQGWTLNYEMVFYVLFGAAMLLPRRAGLTALGAVLLSLVAIGKAAPPSWPPAIVWTDGLLLEFLMGLLIGRASEAGARLGRIGAILAGSAGLAGAILLGPLGGGAVSWIDPWARQGIPAALLVGACVFASPWRPTPLVLALAALGDASYSLYLTQPFTIRILRAGWAAAIGARLPVSVYFCIACSAAVVVGLLVCAWVEQPMTRTLNRLVAGGPVPEAVRAGSPMAHKTRPATLTGGQDRAGLT